MDVLIGDRESHPSLRLTAGQVADFAEPYATFICPICGKPMEDENWHPGRYAEGEHEAPEDGALTHGGNYVTYGGDYVTYGV